ncbi:hypothetical protein [Thermaurantiacus sp.]
MTERQALFIAALAHFALLSALSLAIRLAPPSPPPSDVTPVEFIRVGKATVSPSPAAPAPEPAMVLPAPDPAPAPAEAAPAEAPAPDPAPATQADVPPPAPSDLAIQDAVVREPVRPAPRPSPAAATPAQPFDASALEALIDRSAKRAARRPPAAAEATARGTAPGTPGPQALASLEAAIRSQIAPCWNPPVGGQDVKAMTVVLRIRLHRDGSLASPPEFVSQTGATEANAAYARAFVETARRAVLRCSPLDLPAELYAHWREFELNFDPRMMT